ncbi:MAG: histidinol-phosphate transaminase [Candidatus Hadarchaeales archaeon]
MISPTKKVKKFFESGATYPYSSAYGEKAEEYINLSSNESPYGPSPSIKRLIKKEITKLSLYPDPACTELKREISKFLEVSPDCLVIGNGSDEIMDLVCKAFLEEGEKVFIPLPSFAIYEMVSRLYGGCLRFYKLPKFEWRNDIASKARGCKLAFVGRPNNPTGNLPPKSLVEKISKMVGILVIDEAYIEFSDEESLAKWASEQSNVLVLRTFSKAFGLAGLRIGYGVGNPKLVQLLDAIRLPFNINRIAQAAAIAALRDKKYFERVVRIIKSEREKMAKELKSLGLRPLPSQANFLMVDVKPWNVNAEDFCKMLMRKKILVRSLVNFRGAGENFVRITIGSPEQNRELIAALKELRRNLS